MNKFIRNALLSGLLCQVLATISLFVNDESGFGVYFLPGVIFGIVVMRTFPTEGDTIPKAFFIMASSIVYILTSLFLPQWLGEFTYAWPVIGITGGILVGVFFLLLIYRNINMGVFFVLLTLFSAVASLPLYLPANISWVNSEFGYYLLLFSVFPLWQTGFALAAVLSAKKPE
jgi:hypothetical protein